MRLYKNLKKKYLNAFKSDGEVLISPLSSYRDIGDDLKEDDLEGLFGLRFRPKETIKAPSEEFNFLDSGLSINGGYIQLDARSSSDFHIILPEVYVLCVSEEPKNHLGSSYYEITDPTGFGDELARTLTKIGKTVAKWCLVKVDYEGYKENVTAKPEFDFSKPELAQKFEGSAYFYKPSRYLDDKEWRYIFFLEDDSKVAVMPAIQNKALLDFCTF